MKVESDEHRDYLVFYILLRHFGSRTCDREAKRSLIVAKRLSKSEDAVNVHRVRSIENGEDLSYSSLGLGVCH